MRRLVALPLLLVISCLIGIGSAHAITVTFDLGPAGLVNGGHSYIENGMQFDFFGDPATFIPNGSGFALGIHLRNDILIHRVGGGPFKLVSFDVLGGGNTRFGGFHGNFVTGGQLPDVSIGLSGLAGTIHPFAGDPAWGNVDMIDWCGYCIVFFFPDNAIDNLTFEIEGVEVPEPSTLLLVVTAVVGVATIAGHRRFRRSSRA